MSQRDHRDHDLAAIARQALIDRDFLPDFPADVEKELATIKGPAQESGKDIRDLRDLLWCSIDNDDSRDLDQLTVAEPLAKGQTKIMIAIADVDAIVKKGSAIDRRAQHNTTSIYTAGTMFPMLPEKLSTDLTSLNQDQDRLAVVVELTVGADGDPSGASDVYRAMVRNKAKLAYNSVDAWRDERAEAPPPLKAIQGLEENLRLQDQVAQALRKLRHEQGALDLETIEARATMRDGRVVELTAEEQNQAKQLIEDFMIAANGVTARFLEAHKFASIRRVVRSPERWERIVSVAEELGEKLPGEPDAKALEEFLLRRRKADPLRFPDLSLTIVKLMGAGEYVLEIPGQEPVGHFGLAVKDYAHSTAPNRRYPDVITQRLIKAALAGGPTPYSVDELGTLAQHCTEKEDDANRVERQVGKSAAAMLLEDKVGDRFDAIVTGHGPKGTWVRILHPPVEGKLVHGDDGVDVGDRLRVKLIETDVERGFIDFVRTH
jgi:VacB/RNase II family 3'-5' exoribonuclease